MYYLQPNPTHMRIAGSHSYISPRSIIQPVQMCANHLPPSWQTPVDRSTIGHQLVTPPPPRNLICDSISGLCGHVLLVVALESGRSLCSNVRMSICCTPPHFTSTPTFNSRSSSHPLFVQVRALALKTHRTAHTTSAHTEATPNSSNVGWARVAQLVSGVKPRADIVKMKQLMAMASQRKA